MEVLRGEEGSSSSSERVDEGGDWWY